MNRIRNPPEKADRTATALLDSKTEYLGHAPGFELPRPPARATVAFLVALAVARAPLAACAPPFALRSAFGFAGWGLL
jgi:hypothetical protein